MAEATPDKDGEHTRWVTEIRLYEKEAEEWETKSKKILKRYKDERKPNDQSSRFNILWSNIQTLAPALYAKNPKPDIERRFKDKDDVGRFASDVLERSVSYFVNTDLFSACMKQAVLDRLLPGRGTAWVRYVPHMRDMAVEGSPEVKAEGAEITDDVEAGDKEDGKPQQEVYYEEVAPDYVHWQDFGHSVARTWEEAGCVWRKVYMTREELIKRFGKEKADKISLDYTPKSLGDEKVGEQLKKATIYELWSKPDKEAIWLHKDVDELLDQRDDPLGLPDFFPCPRPMYPRLANDSLIPVPDYAQYQDQAQELDDLTSRIASITKAVKVAGVCDGSAEGLQRLLSEGVENQLVAVDQWAAMAEKGGLKGCFELLPMKDIATTLLTLYEARDKVKNDLYEITGISDIIRGATNAQETATAQKIKGQFATLRLDDMQDDVQRFAREMVRISAHIIAEHFSLDTIKQISGVKLMTAAEKQQAQAMLQQQQMQAQQAAQMAQQQGQQPPEPPPIPDELKQLLADPTWEDVISLLKNDAMRCFRIDIETDSTIKMDEDAERDARIEFVKMVGGYLQQAMQIQNPAVMPLVAQMLMFAVRGFKVGKELESTFEAVIQKLEDAADLPPPQAQQDPSEMIKAIQAEADMKVQKAQVEAGQQVAAAQMDKKATEQKAASEKTITEVERIVTEFERKMMDTAAASKEAGQQQDEVRVSDMKHQQRMDEMTKMHQEMMGAIQQVLARPQAPL